MYRELFFALHLTTTKYIECLEQFCNGREYIQIIYNDLVPNIQGIKRIRDFFSKYIYIYIKSRPFVKYIYILWMMLSQQLPVLHYHHKLNIFCILGDWYFVPVMNEQ